MSVACICTSIHDLRCCTRCTSPSWTWIIFLAVSAGCDGWFLNYDSPCLTVLSQPFKTLMCTQSAARWSLIIIIITTYCHFKKHRCSRRSCFISSPGSMAAGWTLISISSSSIFSSRCHQGLFSDHPVWGEPGCTTSTCRDGSVSYITVNVGWVCLCVRVCVWYM